MSVPNSERVHDIVSDAYEGCLREHSGVPGAIANVATFDLKGRSAECGLEEATFDFQEI